LGSRAPLKVPVAASTAIGAAASSKSTPTRTRDPRLVNNFRIRASLSLDAGALYPSTFRASPQATWSENGREPEGRCIGAAAPPTRRARPVERPRSGSR
jgi:hypothetical protein